MGLPARQMFYLPPANESPSFHTAVGAENFFWLTGTLIIYIYLREIPEVVKMSDKPLTTHHGLEDCWWFRDDKLVFLILSYNYLHKNQLSKLKWTFFHFVFKKFGGK